MEYNSGVISILKNRRDIINDKFSKFATLRLMKPDAGIYIWIDFSRTGIDPLSIAQKLFIEKEVAVVPGVFFGPSGKNFIRISFGFEEKEKIDDGSKRIAEYLKNLKK